jgi:uncharacterized protein YqfA (UPF0365 family)
MQQVSAVLLLAVDSDVERALWIGGVTLASLLGLTLFAFFLSYGRLWLKALFSGCYIGISRIVGMKLRGVNPHVIVDARIVAHKAGLKINDNYLESHYMAQGNVPNVIRAIIAADKAAIHLEFDRACAIDLAGRDVLEAVKTSVNPRVIDCPRQDPTRPQARMTIDAVAKDGIQLKARARITVRSNLGRLVGGATEETVIARVGEGIVSAIGSADSYKQVLENPDRISKAVLERGLDANTAFDILSIDIADVDVGDNIGAQLEADQAEADMRVAQAKAEERRALAAARNVENQALVVENKAKVTLAEAEVPQAIAQAFREGNLGVMDFYSLKNLQADTDMRHSIAGDQGQARPDTKQA